MTRATPPLICGQGDLFPTKTTAPTLRPYQQRDADAILAHLHRGARGILYALPTGGGKTVAFSHVTRRVHDAAGWETWILVHRRELLRQASASLSRVGLDHGVVAPGYPLSDDPIQVASVDTMGARLDGLRDRLARVRLAIIDEAHHVVAGKWDRACEAMSAAALLGVTATPYRYDGKGLGDRFKVAIEGPSVADLVEAGYLAPPWVFAPTVNLDLSKVKVRGADYVAGDLERAVDTDETTGLAVRAYARLCPGVPTLVFCAGVDHARHVAHAFDRAGWSATSVDGSMTVAERDAAIGGLASGRLQVLTSCEIISEGTDVPVVGAAILLRPTKSTGLYLQQVGRSLRLHPGKERAIIIDMVGNVAEHGMPDEKRRWSLGGGIKGLERVVTATRRCRHCSHVTARAADEATCPNCGRKFPVRRTGGASELQLATMAGFGALDAATIAGMRLSRILEFAKTRDELEIVARIKGYKRGWVDHVLNDRALSNAGYRRVGGRWG